MKTILFTSIILFGGCGSSGGGSSDSGSSKQTEEVSAVSDTSSLSKVDSNDFIAGTKLVDRASDVGPCTSTAHRQLIYIIETNEFNYCSKTGEWLPIDLKGPKGEGGTQGVAGRDGRDGATGADGATGPAGRDGRDGDDGDDGNDAGNLAANEWLHPSTGKKWFLGRYAAPYIVVRESSICPTGSYSPTNDEMTDAVKSGILTRLSGFSFSSSSGGIVRVAQESATSWRMTYLNVTNFEIYSNLITSDEISNQTYGALWSTKTYIFCVVN